MKFVAFPCAAFIVLATACSADSGTAPGGSTGSSSSSSGSGSTSTGAGGTDSSGTTGGTTVGSGGSITVPMGGSGGSSDVANGECDQVNFESSRKPVEVLLVLDRSASMTEHYVAPGVDRWMALAPAVSAAVTNSDAAISWGLKLFPTGIGEQCTATTITQDIEIPIAAMNAATVTGLIGTTPPTGNGTPTGDAIAAGAAYLATLPAGVNRYLLLATDGDPSCPSGGDAALAHATGALTTALGQGFPTFVLGVVDADTKQERLNAMALAGGVPRPIANPIADKFYAASTPEELDTALAAITGQIPSCEFPFDKAPPDPTNIAVKINGEKVDQDTTHAGGWDYTGDDHMGVVLYGATCEAVKDASSNTIDMIFGCPGVPIK